jgi:serine/threonine-protein kinase
VKAAVIRPQVEATAYKPLLAELFAVVGMAHGELGDPVAAETNLHLALSAAEAGGDDVTAARAAASLAYVVGLLEARAEEGKRWASLAHAILDRVGPGHSRIRSWILTNESSIAYDVGEFERTRALAERAVALKLEILGEDHPDLAVSLEALGIALLAQGHAEAALQVHDRSTAILDRHADPHSPILGVALSNRGEALLRLKRSGDARRDFERSLRIHEATNPETLYIAFSLTGLAEAFIADGNPTDAIPLLERALRIRKRVQPDSWELAETQFSLSRALWDARTDRKRALALARVARATYASRHRNRELAEIDIWLTTSGSR